MMNRTTVVGLAILGVLVGGLWLLREGQLAGQGAKDGEAAKEKEPRKIHTSGSATVRVKPNRARLYLAVEATEKTVKSARAANKKYVESIIASIQGLKIADLKMKSTNVDMSIIHAKDEKQTKLPEILGYRVTYTFTVLVSNDDTEKLAATAAKVLDTALENGANFVQQITFFRDDLTEARRQALTKATEEAVANAKALATGAKRTISDVIVIDGNPQYMQEYANPTNTHFTQPAAGSDATQLVAGDMEVTCRVSVTATYGAK